MGQRDPLRASVLPPIPPTRPTPTRTIMVPKIESYEVDVALDDLDDVVVIRDEVTLPRTRTRPLNAEEVKALELRLAEERRIAANAVKPVRNCK